MWKCILSSLLLTLTLTAYSQDLANQLCHLTVAAYCKPADVQKWTCSACKDSPLQLQNVKVLLNSSMDTLGFIATSKDLQAIILSFRGTVPWDIKNWISDINFITTPYPLCSNKCNVHRGFYSAFTDIKKQVVDSVNSYQSTHGLKKIIITGHSLGGAIATHAAAQLMTSGHAVSQLYTFGSPRVGDSKYSVWFDERFGTGHFKARVTHGRDPVPHLPTLDMGFKHISTEVFYKQGVKSGFVVCNDGAGQEDMRCSDQYYVDPLISDHLSYMDIDFTSNILKCQ